jgi:hypothetical protein
MDAKKKEHHPLQHVHCCSLFFSATLACGGIIVHSVDACMSLACVVHACMSHGVGLIRQHNTLFHGVLFKIPSRA